MSGFEGVQGRDENVPPAFGRHKNSPKIQGKGVSGKTGSARKCSADRLANHQENQTKEQAEKQRGVTVKSERSPESSKEQRSKEHLGTVPWGTAVRLIPRLAGSVCKVSIPPPSLFSLSRTLSPKMLLCG